MKTQYLLRSSLIGLIGGLISWELLHFFWWIHPQYAIFPFLGEFVYEGIFTGIGIGSMLFCQRSLMYQNLSRLKSRLFLGILFGGLFGGISFSIAQLVYGQNISAEYTITFAWGGLGLLLSFLKIHKNLSSRSKTTRLLGGLLGGLLCGQMLTMTHSWESSYGILLPIFGMVLSFILALAELLSSNSYLRVLTGPSKGQTYLLGGQLKAGYATDNEILLRGYSEVCAHHAQINTTDTTCNIINEQSGGQVLVNYRLINQQSLKDGDIIKIGTALIQYCGT